MVKWVCYLDERAENDWNWTPLYIEAPTEEVAAAAFQVEFEEAPDVCQQIGQSEGVDVSVTA